MNKKSQKKKDREKSTKRKALLQQEESRQKLKEERKADLEYRKKIPKLTPITRENFEKAKKIRNEEILLHLEHNMKILQALQEADDAEKASSGLTANTELTPLE